MARFAAKRPPTTRPTVTAGVKWPPEIGPTAKAIASTDSPTAKATATSPPPEGAENNAAPQTAVTSVNVPMNSAPSSRGDDMNPPMNPSLRLGRGRITWFTRSGSRATGVGAACAYSSRAGVGGLVLESIRVRHRNDVVAGVDEMYFAGHAGGEVRQQIKPGAPKLLQGDAASERRMLLLEGEHRACIADAGAGKRADR